MKPWALFTAAWTYGTLPGRTPALYRQVVEALDVVHAERYQPELPATFCNVFLSDATKALGCEIPLRWPHPMSSETSVAVRDALAGFGVGGIVYKELRANDQVDWLHNHGREHGWAHVDQDHARARASAGFPTVAVWRAQVGPGHLAVVLPSPKDGPVHIAQAGRDCLFDVPLEHGFGRLEPQFYTHD